MDDFKVIDDLPTPDSGMHLDDEARDYLYKTGNWAMGFAILGLIGIGLGFLSNILTFIGAASVEYDTGFGSDMTFIAFFSLLSVIVLAIPIWKHYTFAKKSKEAVKKSDSRALTEALKNLYDYYIWYGVLLLIFVISYVAIFILAINYWGNYNN